MTEVETTPAPPADSGPESGSVYEWLSENPLASSAASSLYNWYEGSKSYCRASDYALSGIESSVKYAAETAAPLVKKLDRPSKCVMKVFCTVFLLYSFFCMQFMQWIHLLQSS